MRISAIVASAILIGTLATASMAEIQPRPGWQVVETEMSHANLLTV